MTFQRRDGKVWLGLILILITSLVAIGCVSDYAKSPTEPVGGGSRLFDMIIENQTDQVLTIYYYNYSYEVGVVKPGGSIVQKVSWNRGSYPIIAENAQGETVFSETYTFKTKDKYHLQEIDDRTWKAVISPLKD